MCDDLFLLKLMADDDLFDAVSNAEEKQEETGYEEGLKQGRLEGRTNGFVTGQTKGVELGEEIGYYLGFAETLLEINLDGLQSNAKLKRLASSLVSEIKGYRCLDFSSPTYQDELHQIRAKFKQICSILKFKEPDGINMFLAKQQSF